jgi:Kef-type K+ transport system membrane component KefB
LCALTVPLLLWRLTRLRRVMPLAVVQILTGILLGPSLLGRLAPELLAPMIGPTALAPLEGIATLAVILFALVTGLHADAAILRGLGAAIAWLGLGSALLPMAAGAGAGLLLAHAVPEALGPRATAASFAAGVGIAAGVTALPVLGAILAQMGLLERRLGQLALVCAAMNDALLWGLLALLLAAVGSGGGDAGHWLVLLGGPLYVLLVLWLVRPWLHRLASDRVGGVSQLGLGLACAGALGSAAVTELLGLHAVLGAFLAGLAAPDSVRRALLERLEPTTAMVLMPFFFVLTGLRTTIEPGSVTFLAVFVANTLAAVLGKLGGTALLARSVGESWPTALGLGALLQTKGLMEVVVLTVLLDAGLIAPPAFSALVLMALVSTAITMPLTRLLAPDAARDG